MPSFLDHIVITAPTLDMGIQYVCDNLGIMPQKGGEHEKMGTHNYLLKLGHSIYLEVIAINPNSQKPARPRWFDLDNLPLDAKPRLLTWVARTDDIKIARENSLVEFGSIENMSRGDINWRITISPDGSLPCDGVAPSLIQWESSSHPTSKMPDSGCTLIRLEGFHQNAEAIDTTLRSIDFQGPFSTKFIESSAKPYLVAHIKTPTGICSLS